jgi:hypothetical protein
VVPLFVAVFFFRWPQKDWLLKARAHNLSKLEKMVKRKQEAFISEELLMAIHAKEWLWLTLKEASLLLNVSPLRRWVLAGKTRSETMGNKHAFSRMDLIKIP